MALFEPVRGPRDLGRGWRTPDPSPMGSRFSAPDDNELPATPRGHSDSPPPCSQADATQKAYRSPLMLARQDPSTSLEFEAHHCNFEASRQFSRTPSPMPRFYNTERQLKDLRVELPSVFCTAAVGWTVPLLSSDVAPQMEVVLPWSIPAVEVGNEGCMERTCTASSMASTMSTVASSNSLSALSCAWSESGKTAASPPPPPGSWQQENLVPSPPAPFQTSVGSVGHPYTCAQACKYAQKPRGCKDGADCTHCHHCKWHRYERHRCERSGRNAGIKK